MPRYVVHIGPHKTATTYLQGAFRRLQGALAERGVHYSLTWQAAHSPGHSDLLRRLALPKDTALEEEFAAINAGPWRAVLISSEALIRLKPPGLARLKALIAGNPVEIVYYARPWTEVVVSAWHGEIKRGGTSRLPDRLNSHLSDPAASHLINHDRLLRPYAEAFGAASLRIASYGGVMREKVDILDHFGHAFLGIEEMPKVRWTRRNVSLGTIDSEILRALNVIGKLRGAPEALRAGHYYRVKEALTLPLARAAMERDLVESRARINADGLERFHQELLARYPGCLVPPLMPQGRLFAAKLSLPKYIAGDYVYADGVVEELRAAHARALDILASNPVQRGRPGAAADAGEEDEDD